MKTSPLMKILDRIKNSKKLSILDVTEVIDAKVESDMEKVLNRLDSLESKLNSKYNVLVGMISFLTLVVTVITIVTQLK